MDRSLVARMWLITTGLAVAGLLAGLAVAAVVTGRDPQRHTAEVTLAMLPAQHVPVVQAPQYWEVLSRGQATRSAAIVLADPTWLSAAATAAQVPESELDLAAGAIPDTTLISVTLQADSVAAAQRALDSVIEQALVPAASASGPFRLEVVRSGAGDNSSGPTAAQLYLALGFAGALVGGGLGFSVGRTAARTRPAEVPAGADGVSAEQTPQQ